MGLIVRDDRASIAKHFGKALRNERVFLTVRRLTARRWIANHDDTNHGE
jgi:hypothetical protein